MTRWPRQSLIRTFTPLRMPLSSPNLNNNLPLPSSSRKNYLDTALDGSNKGTSRPSSTGENGSLIFSRVRQGEQKNRETMLSFIHSIRLGTDSPYGGCTIEP